jgi:hypothetical protein
MQEAALLHWAATRSAGEGSAIGNTAVTANAAQWAWGSQVWNIFRERMLGANGGDAAFGSFASFSKGIVAGVKVFTLLPQHQSQRMQTKAWRKQAYFELVLEKIFLVGNLAIETEQLLFLLVEGLLVCQRMSYVRRCVTHTDIHFVLLVRIHD